MIELVDLSVKDDEYWTFTEPESVGEYCNIPLEHESVGIPNTIEYTLNLIRSGSSSLGQSFDVAYTYGHCGDEAHRWYMVGYEAFEQSNGAGGRLKLMFAPVYPDTFPTETTLTETNLYDCFYPEIYNRILSDRGKVPPA